MSVQLAVFFLWITWFVGCASKPDFVELGGSKAGVVEQLKIANSESGLRSGNFSVSKSGEKPKRVIFNLKENEVLELRAIGSFRYGPKMSESQACAKAINNMQVNAVRNTVGIALNRDSSLTCSTGLMNSEGTDCLLLDVMWDAAAEATLIRDVQIAEQKSYEVEGARECRVSGKVSIERLGRKKDKFIVDLKVMPSNQLRNGQELSFFVSSAKYAYHYIYSYENDLEDAHLIFPNEYDSKNQFVGERLIPSPELKGDFYFEAALPDGQDYVVEHLLMVSSQRDLGFLPRRVGVAKLREMIASTDAGYFSLTRSFYEVK